MGKEKLSVTVDDDLIKLIDTMLEDNRFRNRSHIVELALTKLVREENE
ncbi:MAG: ribbon-helix-helix domain-containing protein [Nanoarchaeota archaeon]|nr:ribbon-helix-helix domain-containing protein [Nanoarchaeota archaeon]